MSDTNYTQLISDYLTRELDLLPSDELEEETNLIAEGLLDSMSAMRLVNHIETSLSIKIPPRDLLPKNFMSVQAIASYLQSRD